MSTPGLRQAEARPEGQTWKRPDSDCKMSRQSSRTGKRPVAAPTSFSKFVVIFVMHICRKILLTNIFFKLGIYVFGVAIGSLITDLMPLPKTYFSRKDNFINVYFVKYGWGWTFSLLSLYIILTTRVYTANKREVIGRHMIRPVISTIWWYFCTSVFNVVENKTGVCTVVDPLDSKLSCIRKGGSWLGFDISGHTFLMVFSLLTIVEELSSFEGWDKIPELLKSNGTEACQVPDRLTCRTIKENYELLTPVIRVLVLVIAVLHVMWEVMLLATTIYFHNLPQKMCGVVFACLGWFVTYRMWYRTEISPGLPGNGMIKYNSKKVR